MEQRFSSASRPSKIFFRTIAYLRYHPFKTALVLVVAIINVAISLIGTSMLKPVIDNLITPTLEGIYTTAYLGERLLILSMSLLGLYILSFILGIVQMRVMITISQESVSRMRKDLFDKLQKLPLSFFDSNTHGDIMSRFTNDIDRVNEVFSNSFLEVLTCGSLFIGIFIALFINNWLLTLIAIVIFPLVFIAVKIFTRIARRGFDGTQKALGELNGFIEETLSGQKIVKVFNYEEEIEKSFETINQEVRKTGIVASFYSSITIPIVNNFSSLLFIICTIIGSVFSFVYKIEWMPLTVGTLSVFITLIRQLNRPLNRTANQLNIIQAALAGAERVFTILDLDEEEDGKEPLYQAIKDESTGKYYWVCGDDRREVLGDVRFKDVDFSYVSGQPVLKNISLYAEPGQKIAFVGSTGAGKTTITNLLTRFYDIDAGTITIDGIDLHHIDRKSMRKSMSLVLQDTHLFSGTIMDNIRYGRLSATDEECIAAAKLAHADEFITKLKNGYETVISGGNDSLSQGQRQLLSIARAAVANPPILILDEATSSIDTRTERLIEKGMDELMENKTVLVIAHRLSTIRHSNAIMVLEHGEIIERGNHEDLLAQKGRYYSLCTGKFELS